MENHDVYSREKLFAHVCKEQIDFRLFEYFAGKNTVVSL